MKHIKDLTASEQHKSSHLTGVSVIKRARESTNGTLKNGRNPTVAAAWLMLGVCNTPS